MKHILNIEFFTESYNVSDSLSALKAQEPILVNVQKYLKDFNLSINVDEVNLHTVNVVGEFQLNVGIKQSGVLDDITCVALAGYEELCNKMHSTADQKSVLYDDKDNIDIEFISDLNNTLGIDSKLMTSELLKKLNIDSSKYVQELVKNINTNKETKVNLEQPVIKGGKILWKQLFTQKGYYEDFIKRPELLPNATALVTQVEKILERFPDAKINTGYRPDWSKEEKDKKKKGDHAYARAIDLDRPGNIEKNIEMAEWCMNSENGIVFSQIIIERGRTGDGWVHVAVGGETTAVNRALVMREDGKAVKLEGDAREYFA